MKISKKGLALGAGALALAAVAVSTVPAFAATTTAPLYLVSSTDGTAVTPGSTLQWTTDVSGSPEASNTGADKVFVGSSDATGVYQFLTTVGQEDKPTTYLAYSVGGFQSSSNKNVLLPPLQLSSMVLGNQAGVKAAGGDYSLGFAFTKDNGVNIASAGVVFTKIHVTAGTGAWTFDQPTPTAPTGTPKPTSTADVPITAQVTSSADGPLTLSVASGSVTLPSVAGGQSVTANLPTVTVSDARYTSHPGWNLTASVAAFTSGGSTIPASALGVVPGKLSGTQAVTLGAATTAGSATYPMTFATASNAAVVGDSTFGASLTFVPPVGSTPGAYTSKMTLTLVGQ